MLGVFVNVFAVVGGSLLGLLFKKGISKRFSDSIMIGLGLCVVMIGIVGILKGSNTLVAILSMIFGALVGTGIDLDKRVNRLGDFLRKKFKKEGDRVSIAEGFVTASLLFCIGAMAIVGSLESGLSGNHTTLFTKSIIDCVSAVMLSASLGIGVIFSAVFILVYRGGIALLSGLLQNVLNDASIAEITCVGSLLILALGLNMIGITKIKVANYLPSLIFVPLFVYLFDFLSKWIPAFA